MSAPEPLLVVVRRLGDLRERVVFVGGVVRGLLLTDPAAASERPTAGSVASLLMPAR